jgi:predicted dehydrogenase
MQTMQLNSAQFGLTRWREQFGLTGETLMTKFAAIGVDHRHILDHIKGLTRVGAQFAGYCPVTTVPSTIAAIARDYPDVPQVPQEQLLGDPSIQIICTAAVPRDRAGIAIQAMQAGKDVIADKPGLITYEQLEAVRSTVAQTQRIFSICFTERHSVRSAVTAERLVREGAVGEVVQTMGAGPHRLGSTRPDWFWDPDAFGGIIVDIASHQIDQFLFYTSSSTAKVVAASVGNFATRQAPRFNDFGEVLLRSDRASGYIRVDWLTPGGLPTWGDGRLIILGTKGYIELRKYIDIGGREGKDHLFLVNETGVQHIDCSSEELTYFKQFLADVRDRTSTSGTHEHVFEVCRLSLEAQAAAESISSSARE